MKSVGDLILEKSPVHDNGGSSDQSAKKRVSANRSVSKSHMPGFPAMSQLLPEDLDHEDIIKQYPNHLHGPLLLRILETWQPKEISVLSGVKANTIVHRVRAAKIKRDGIRPAKRVKKNIAPSKDETNATPSAYIESEASRRFLEQQLMHKEIEEAYAAR